MQAMIYRRYGGPDVLQLETVATPTIGPNDVLVQVRAVGLNAADGYLLHGKPLIGRLASGLRAPKNPILGADIAGQVVEVGSAVKMLRPGDAVYGDLSGSGFGGFAEYVRVRADTLLLKPQALSYAQAAAVPMAAVTALRGLRAAEPIAGQDLLIHGASGGVGSFVLQIAKAFGARITAVCSTRNLELARQLGADRVIDYTQDDFLKHQQRYDAVLVVNGQRKLTDYCRVLRRNGRCIVVGGAVNTIMAALFFGPWIGWRTGTTVRSLIANPNPHDLAVLSDLLEAGTIKPVLDRSYPLHELPEALRYHAAGHAQGKIIITIDSPNH